MGLLSSRVKHDSFHLSEKNMNTESDSSFDQSAEQTRASNVTQWPSKNNNDNPPSSTINTFEDDEANLTTSQDLSFPTKNFYSCIRQEHERKDMVQVVAYSPDDETIAVGGYDGKVVLLDSSTFDVLKELEIGDRYISAVAYSPSGNTIAVGGSDEKFVLLDGSTFEVLKNLEIGNCIRAVAYSPDGNTIAIFGNRKVILLDSFTFVSKEHEIGGVGVVAYSPDGKYIAIGESNKVFLLDSCNFQVLNEHERRGLVKALAYSPDGKIIAVGGYEKKVVLLDSISFETLKEQEIVDCVQAVAYSPDGNTIVFGGYNETVEGGYNGKVVLLDSTSFEKVKEHQRGLSMYMYHCVVAYSPDGKTIAVGGSDKKVVLLDTTTFDSLNEYERKDTIRAVSYSPDGKTIASHGNNTVVLLDSSTSEVLREQSVSLDPICTLTYSPDSKTIVVEGIKDFLSSSICLLDSTTLKTLQCGLYGQDAVAFSPDGKTIATNGLDGKAILLDTTTWKVTHELTIGGSRGIRVAKIAYSHDGKSIAICTMNNKVLTFDTSSSDILGEHTSECVVEAVAFSPDDKSFLVGGLDGKIILLETSTCNVIQEFKVGDQYILMMTYTPDRKFLAVGAGKELILLDPKNKLKPVGHPILFPDEIRSISFYEGANKPTSMDVYPVAVANGNFCTIMTLHRHSYTPVQVLLRNKTDEVVYDFMNKNNAPDFTRRNLIQVAMKEKDERVDIVTYLLKNDPSLALVPNDFRKNGASNGIFEFLKKRRLLKELNAIAESNLFRAHTSSVQLTEMLTVLCKLSKIQIKRSVVKLLSSGENDSMEGLVSVGEVYALDVPKRWPLLPNWLKFNTRKDMLPLATEQEPRSSKTSNVHSTWHDLKPDEDRRVQLKIVRVSLPGLASFDSLKSLMKMKEYDAFEAEALSKSIDANWTSWARKKFYLQALLYMIWLASFTTFCEITRDMNKDDVLQTQMAHVLATITICGIFYFAWYEFRQMKTLGWIHYWCDLMNVLQWIAKALATVTTIMRVSSRTSLRVNAFISAISLLFTWFGAFFYLQGFEECAWIVIALLSIAQKMKYFLLVVIMTVFSFALGLRALYERENNLRTSGYGNIGSAMLTTLFAGLFGDFDLAELDDTYSKIFAVIIMIVMLLMVLIISMNALIAFISDAFEQVLAQKQAVLKRQKAQMIFEMYSSMTKVQREALEEEHRWTSLIIPVATLDVHEPKAAAINFAKATKEDIKKMARTNKEMKEYTKKEFDGMKKDMKKAFDGRKEDSKDINGMKEDINGMKEDINGMKDEMKGIKEGITTLIKLMEDTKNGENNRETTSVEDSQLPTTYTDTVCMNIDGRQSIDQTKE